jgi:hypothetical protein
MRKFTMNGVFRMTEEEGRKVLGVIYAGATPVVVPATASGTGVA